MEISDPFSMPVDKDGGSLRPMFIDKDGDPRSMLVDKDGFLRAMLVDKDGDPWHMLVDKDGDPWDPCSELSHMEYFENVK